MIFDIKNPRDLKLLRRAMDGKKVGLTSGCYDLFHNMHLIYLTRCSRLCDYLIVGVDSDDMVRNYKGPQRPIVPEHQRVSLINGLNCVHASFVMGELQDFQRAVDELGVKAIFKNQAFKPEEVLGKDKAEIVIIPDITQHDSTTGIIENIKRQMTTVNKEVKIKKPAKLR
jgi:D-beta-D-heptose 7-phosphate kinase/D-beta-D-heptose 1-phosphate adenosyltransferase